MQRKPMQEYYNNMPGGEIMVSVFDKCPHVTQSVYVDIGNYVSNKELIVLAMNSELRLQRTVNCVSNE